MHGDEGYTGTVRNAGHKGAGLYQEALRLDELARTREDYSCVEEAYWMAFNALADSSEEEHREIRARILERIARQLDGEGRGEAARDLRERAMSIREGSERDI